MLASIRTSVRIATSDEGASAVEYGLILAAIAAVIVAVVFAVGVVVKSDFSKTSTCIDAQATSTC